MIQDHYATLGVEPRAEAAAIRAAYLALMRRYHPDKNDSPAAVERAHAVIAAFAVLGDVEKRLHYDWGRRRAAEAAEEAQRSWRGWGPRAVMVLGGVLLLLVTVIVMPRVEVPTPPAAPVAEIRETVPAPGVAELPASYFAPAPVAPVEPEPAVEEAVSPRMIEEFSRATVDVPLPVKAARVAVPDRSPTRASARPKAPPVRTKAACRLARPGAEAAICNDDNLRALDGNVVTFYNQSLVFGTAAKREALLDARGSFLARREACHTADCLRALHLAHLREMTTIVENRSVSRAP